MQRVSLGVLLLPFLLAVLSPIGCVGQQESRKINGIVVGHDKDSPGLLSSDQNPNCYPPIAGATVYLAQTANFNVAIKGFETTTNENGTYEISLSDLPPAEHPEGYYMLVAKKEGFLPLIQKIRVGPL